MDYEGEDGRGEIAAVPKAIGKVDGQLMQDLTELYQVLPKKIRSQLACHTVGYPYGSIVMREGVANGPDGQRLPSELLVSGRTPLGLVVGGTLDVVDGVGHAMGGEAKRPISIAQIESGSLIGAFEALDRFNGFEEAAYADWTIFSGINCVMPTLNLTTEGRYKRIARRFEAHLTQHDMSSHKLFGQMIAPFASQIEGVAKWQSEIVYFNEGWFSVIFSDHDDIDVDRLALKVRDKLFRATWEAISVTRNIHSASKKYFYGDDQGKASGRRKSNQAYRFFEAVVDVSLGRRPVFRAVSEDTNMSPAASLQENFVSKVESQCGLMQPEFLDGSKGVGFLPFVYFLPELVDGHSAAADSFRKIRECLSYTIAASHRLVEMTEDDDSVPFLRNFSNLIGCLKVRVPGEKGTRNHYALEFSSTISHKKISEEEFFEGLPLSDEIDYRKWREFNHCLRIDLEDFPWP